MAAHVHAADLLLHVAAVQQGHAAAGVGVVRKADVDVVQPVQQGVLHQLSILDQAFLQHVKGHRAVHGTAVDVSVAEVAGQLLGEGALPAGGEAVDGDVDAGGHGARKAAQVTPLPASGPRSAAPA